MTRLPLTAIVSAMALLSACGQEEAPHSHADGEAHSHGEEADSGEHGHPHDAEAESEESHGHPHGGEAEDVPGEEAGHGHAHGENDANSGHGHAHEATEPESDDGHEHAAASNGEEHGHGGGITVTDFTDSTQLFVEFPPLAIGEESAFAAHFTDLDGFSPIDSGRATVRLTGGGQPDEAFASGPSGTPGIFRPVATPRYAAERQVQLEIETPSVTAIHDLGTYRVFRNPSAAQNSLPHEAGPEGAISFLMEQQWKVRFDLAQAEERVLRESVPATGVLRGTSDGQAMIQARAAGTLTPASGAFPRLGQTVEAGQTLARLTPRLGSGEDLETLRSAAETARVEEQLAASELNRLEGLLAEGVVPASRVEEARARLNVARSRLNAARTRLNSAQGGSSGGGVALTAPIKGVIARAYAGPGEYVEEGAPIFQIVSTERLWLEASVSEIYAPELGQPSGAWFSVDSRSAPIVLTPDRAELIAAGGAVDPVKRTIPVIFEFANPGGLRVGSYVNPRIWTGETVSGTAVPASAVIDETGQDIVYVMLGGETFERRTVQTGITDSGFVQIVSGVEPGEYVVSEGAYLVRLAASGPAEAGHGHAH
ncbi:efflux RND transporter periplasmic adaptor subunit [Euryhalocaulis caribicus]|uniref:efflux RND transporter periplasmic adaptor subunit n=1 Tax=Euryhalocaulis caribicus TaxID=1161401 RepID=UPI0012687885|nr:efflux RND transporter periplasmic adaptor subunit [Euryhalocaulis caribicus]